MVELREIGSLEPLADLVGRYDELYVRWSRGPDADAGEQSRDHASGLEPPGLAVNPLTPPGWWTLPVEDWLARREPQSSREADQHASWRS